MNIGEIYLFLCGFMLGLVVFADVLVHEIWEDEE